jgi:hypothetical protein
MNVYEQRDAELKANACKGVYQRGEWVQWSTPIPNEVGEKIIRLLAPYCRSSHGEASFGHIIDFPDGRYMIIGTTDDDVGDGFTWIMFNGKRDA